MGWLGDSSARWTQRNPDPSPDHSFTLECQRPVSWTRTNRERDPQEGQSPPKVDLGTGGTQDGCWECGQEGDFREGLTLHGL